MIRYKPFHPYHTKHLYAVIGMILFFCVNDLRAQVFPGLEGEELADAIRTDYTPSQLLNDTQVKDTLYARIFIENDSVKCIYSGLPHYLPSGVDPSQWVFGSGNEIESINLEHGWPQAKGAGDGTNGNMNMHHLYPSRVAINSDRADFPYSDIEDHLTQIWYYLGQEMSSIPISNIEAYSEFDPGVFEPRESVKGDIARAMFYFWTIYRSDAVAADPGYFELQRENLCSWHEQDPVDDFESLRNDRIAVYQDGKKNPFILDCTLAERAYCPQNPECEMVAVHNTQQSNFKIIFDPYQRRLRVVSEDDGEWNLSLSNLYGQFVYSDQVESNRWTSSIDVGSGIYLAFAYHGSDMIVSKIFVP